MSDKNLEKPTLSPRYCGNCGTPIPPGKHFCEVCLAPASLATLTPPPPPAEPAAPPPAAAAAPVPVAPEPPQPRGPEVVLPGGPAMSTPAPAVPTMPVEPPAPAVIPVPPGAPPPQLPTVPSGRPPVAPYVPPPIPAAPARPSSWWLVLMIGSIVMATLSLFLACLLLLVAADAGDAELRLVGIFCCLVPGLLMGAAGFVGGRQYFRKRP